MLNTQIIVLLIQKILKVYNLGLPPSLSVLSVRIYLLKMLKIIYDPVLIFELYFSIAEELISSVASISLTDSCHSVNEEVTPCVDAITDGHGPRPPPPPPGSLIGNTTDLLPPVNPTAEANLSSTTQAMDNMHMQESYTPDPDYSLKRENENLRMENAKLKSKMQRFYQENLALLNQNTILQNQNTSLLQRLKESGMPVPEQDTGSRKQSEMVPKGSGTY